MFLLKTMRLNLSFILACLAFLIFGQSANAATLFGVTTSNQLVRFDSTTPGTVSTIGTISGLQTGESILGIDFRPANGQLFGLGSTSRLYTINIMTGAATAVAATPFTPALSGVEFGFDFNPTVDRIRLVSDSGQNLRLNPDTGMVAATDTALNPGTPNIVGAAYTNNFSGATTTTLYDIDSTTDTLYTQNPPNNGTLVPVGALGVNTTNQVGFDIARGSGTAFASMQIAAEAFSRLYTINLTTGAATALGQIGTSTGIIKDITVFTRATVDFDGDRKTDLSIFRIPTNTWWVQRSSSSGLIVLPFGLSQSDILTPADFDGDGRTDFAIWRTTDGNFWVFRSSDNTVQVFRWGFSSDEPVARDFDGDGKADYAIARRENGAILWWISNSSNGSTRVERFGLDSDVLAPGDYDGDGRTDIAVKRNSTPSVFFVNQTRDGFRAVQFGVGTDLAVPGDYDGDGRTDIATVSQGTTLIWSILQSSSNTVASTQLGSSGDFPTQGDYDGDGKTDVSVWVPQTGAFYVNQSTNGSVLIQIFGLNIDIPVAGFDSF